MDSIFIALFQVLKALYNGPFFHTGILQYTPKKSASIFVACCVLHNIAMRHGLELRDYDEAR